MAEIEYNPRVVDMDDELDDEELDETLTERLVGLTEMLPEWLRRSVATSADWTWWATKSAAGLAQSTLWVVSTSALIMVVPYAIEKERSDMEKSQVLYMLLFN